MGHDHAHPHGGGLHGHEPHEGRAGHGGAAYGRAFAIGIALNLAFVVVEVGFGLFSRSLALVADAAHNLGDVLGLGLSWGATVLAGLPPSRRRTFGYRRSTILASVANALLLLLVTGAILWESIRRLSSPEPAHGRTMIVVALVGATINTASALLFLGHGDGHRDLNVRSAFLHLASDAVLALGVALSGFLILATGWLFWDPIMSLVLAATILAGTWGLMKRSMNLILDAVPEGIDPERVDAFLRTLPGVVAVHDLHIWAMSTTETALMAHLVTPGGAVPATFLADTCKRLHDEFRIGHTTLQIDPAEAPSPCALAPDEVL